MASDASTPGTRTTATPAPSARRAASPVTATELLFPQAYRGTITGGSRELLPALKPWIWLLVLVLVALLLASWGLWREATGELAEATERALDPGAAAAASASPGPSASAP